MTTLVNLNGRIVPAGEAKVSVFDRGFLFGDGVYETVRTYHGRPFLLDRHLARLERSAVGLWLPIPGGTVSIERQVRATIAAAGNVESYVRVVVTRGARLGFVDLDMQSAGDGTTVIIVREHKGFDPACYADGVLVALVGVHRTGRRSLDPKIKSGNYLNNIIALREAKRIDAFECLMPNRDGDLTEGSTSNVFLVKDGRLRTPGLECGILDGITRGFVFEVAADAGVAVEEGRFDADDIRDADEMFLTSSLKEIMPIRAVVRPEPRETLFEAPPGPVTCRLHALYRKRALRTVGAES